MLSFAIQWHSQRRGGGGLGKIQTSTSMCIVFSFLVMEIWYLPMLCFWCYSECISTPRAGRKVSLTTMRIKLATFGIQVHQITSKISSYMWFSVELLCVKWLFKITKMMKMSLPKWWKCHFTNSKIKKIFIALYYMYARIYPWIYRGSPNTFSHNEQAIQTSAG